MEPGALLSRTGGPSRRTSSRGPRYIISRSGESSTRVGARSHPTLLTMCALRPSVFSLGLVYLFVTKEANGLVFASYFDRVLWNATRGDDARPMVIPQWVVHTTAVAVVVYTVLFLSLVVVVQSLGSRAPVVLMSIKAIC